MDLFFINTRKKLKKKFFLNINPPSPRLRRMKQIYIFAVNSAG